MNQSNINHPHVVGEPTFEGLARYIEQNNVRKILVMAGAGISVAAGIPDFRSPNTGIYANLEKYDLNSPTDAFSIRLLKERPEVFYNIVCDMDLWPGHYWPTTAHYFIKLIADEGRLLRCYTQNIDGLEKACGIPESLLVEAHGSFSSASCIECRCKYDISLASREAREGKVPYCYNCGGVVKPDVVFFGEDLPESFFRAAEDIKEAELLLIMGTSLQVQPFANLVLLVEPNVPRVLFNLERVGGKLFRFPTDPPTPRNISDNFDFVEGRFSGDSTNSIGSHNNNNNNNNNGTSSDHSNNINNDNNNCSSSSSSSDGYTHFELHARHSEEICRDIFFPGDCQESVWCLAKEMGLEERLAMAIREGENRRM